jgi:hypothetical protein
VGILKEYHQAARPAMGLEPQAHEGDDVPGALPAVENAFLVDKIVEHVNDDQCRFDHGNPPFRAFVRPLID